MPAWEVLVLEEYQRLRPLYYSDASAVFIVFAVDQKESLRNAVEKVRWDSALLV